MRVPDQVLPVSALRRSPVNSNANKKYSAVAGGWRFLDSGPRLSQTPSQSIALLRYMRLPVFLWRMGLSSLPALIRLDGWVLLQFANDGSDVMLLKYMLVRSVRSSTAGPNCVR